MFNGKRLRQARELLRFTQKELARRVGKSQGTIANLEGSFNAPSPELLEQIARETRFPQAFFSSEIEPEFPFDSLMFRSRASTTRRDANAARRCAEIVYEVDQALARYVTPLPIGLPKLLEQPSTAAQHLRAVAGVGRDDPIPHVIDLVERLGVVVLALPLSLEKVDAFSAWIGTRHPQPVIAICSGKAADRTRFSVSHEIGHLVLHAGRMQLRSEEHHEADQFAAEFMMPETAMRREITSPVTLSSIAPLKMRWGVSIQALVRRARDLAITTERHYRYLCEQISARGWRKREPSNLDVAVERPRALRKMAELAFGHPIEYQKLADETRLGASLIKEILDGYDQPPPVAPENDYPLRVVPSRRIILED